MILCKININKIKFEIDFIYNNLVVFLIYIVIYLYKFVIFKINNLV